MKVQIEYFNDRTGTYPCWAKAMFQGSKFLGCGDTWEQAKKSVLRDINKAIIAKSLDIPEPEEVEVDTEAVHANS